MGVVRLCGGEPSRITIYVCVLVFKVPNDLVAPVMGFRFTQCVCVCVCVCETHPSSFAQSPCFGASTLDTFQIFTTGKRVYLYLVTHKTTQMNK